MGRGERALKSKAKTPPVSVAMTKDQRDAFAAEARRRGLGISTTIRSLAVERATELLAQRQRERALRWQTERMRALAERIEAEGFVESSDAEIDALFDKAEEMDRSDADRRRSAATA